MAQDANEADAVASASLQLEAQQSGDASEALHTTDPLREPSAAPAIQGTHFLLGADRLLCILLRGVCQHYRLPALVDWYATIAELLYVPVSICT